MKGLVLFLFMLLALGDETPAELHPGVPGACIVAEPDFCQRVYQCLGIANQYQLPVYGARVSQYDSGVRLESPRPCGDEKGND